MPRGKRKDRKFLTETHPHLLDDWDFVKNKFQPSEVSYGSKEKIFWLCQDGHSWQAKPNDRIAKGSGCPYCRGLKTSDANRLDLLFPEIVEIFDYEKNSIKIEDISFSSHKNIFIICNKCNISFEKSPNKLQYGSLLCSKCNGSDGCSKNRTTNLEYLKYCDEKIFSKNKKGKQTSKYWIANRINSVKSKAKKSNSWDLSDSKVAELLFGNCYYCGSHEFKKIGIDRKDSSLGYSESNCVSCCWFCNSSKSDRSIDQFKKVVSKIALRSGPSVNEKRNLESIIKKYKSNAKRRGVNYSLNDSFAMKLLQSSCNYCGETAFGIDRVDSSIDYQEDNCVPCCMDCNFVKLDFDKSYFLAKIEKIYRNIDNF